MKRLIIIRVLCFSGAVCTWLIISMAHMPIVQRGVSVEISTSVERQFKRDAARLALRALEEAGDIHQQPVEIPIHLLDDFYKMLIGNYNHDPTARALEKCNIHTFPDPSVDHFIIVYSNEAEWTKPLQLGENKTAHPDYEKLMKTYHLKIENHVKWDDRQNAITIRSQQPLNVAALAYQFQNIDGIVKTELSIPQTKGNDIRANKIANGWELDYILRFGVGAKVHTWRYHFLDGLQVDFMGESGDDVPDWMRCDG